MTIHKKLFIIAIISTLILIGGYVWLRRDQPTQNSQPTTQSEVDESANSQPITETQPTQSDAPSGESTSTGIISGSLTYPSEIIPANLIVCAESASSGEEIACTDQHIKDAQRFVYGEGYELKLPEGDYYVYAKLAESDNKSYYNGYIAELEQTGEWPNYDTSKCQTDYLRQSVNVKSGQTVDGITMADWYYQTSCSSNY